MPANLRTVPSCKICNESWSLDEEYLGIVLAQVDHHPHLTAKISPGGSVDRALSRSPRLDDRIVDALNAADDGRIWFTPELARIGRITAKIAFGLYGLQYGLGEPLRAFNTIAIVGPEQAVPPPIVAAQWFWPGIRRKKWTIVQQGTFGFIFAKGWMVGDPPLYCMLDFHGTIFAVVACPPAVGRKANRRLRDKPWR